MASLRRLLPLLVCAAALAALAAGCKSPEQSPFQPNDPRDPKFLPLVNFDDLPLPNNFIVERKTSFSYVHGALRVIDLHMTGLTRAEDVVRFYETQMEVHGWSKRFSLGEPRQRRLEFEKDQETCSVQVSLQGLITRVDLQVTHR